MSEPNGIELDDLADEVSVFERLCLALPECDAKGKLRGKIGRVRTSLTDCVGRGDFTSLNEDIQAMESFVRRLHEQHPLTQLLHKLVAVRLALQDRSRQITGSLSMRE